MFFLPSPPGPFPFPNFPWELPGSLAYVEKTDCVLSSKGKGHESSKGRKENREPWWIFGEFSWCFGYYSLIWVGENKLFTWSNWSKMLLA